MTAITRAPGVLDDVVDGRAMLIDSSGAQVVELNGVGSLVWAAIDGTRDVPALVEQVRAAVEDGPGPERIEADVRAFLTELTRLELVLP